MKRVTRTQTVTSTVEVDITNEIRNSILDRIEKSKYSLNSYVEQYINRHKESLIGLASNSDLIAAEDNIAKAMNRLAAAQYVLSLLDE